MRQKLLILAFLISVISYGQNWNVFNKGYRYNYKFDNSALISNVLFADTVKQTGMDTTYIMNNVGVVNGNTLTINRPQFLMKKIVKLANGNVSLLDTTSIIIIPTCTLNQSWLFDSNYNLTATCVSTSTQTIFNIADSVKTIIVNNVDSVVLSKRFGIIQFPELYGSNNYYKLVGIEKASRYEKNPLFGEKVPNAWDFYDFSIGRQWCETSSNFIFLGPGIIQDCQTNVYTIKSKTITSTGFIYSVDIKYISNSNSNSWCSYSLAPISYSTANLAFVGLDTNTFIENKMYPGMIVYSSGSVANIVRFGMISHITSFNKFYGPFANNYFQMQPGNFIGDIAYNMVDLTTYTVPTAGMDNFTGIYGYGVGKKQDVNCFFQNQHYFYSGCSTTIGLKKVNLNEPNTVVFPNPANTKISIMLDHASVKIYDVFGKIVVDTYTLKNTSLDISNLPNGLYFIEIQTDSFKSSQKLIIQH